MITINYKVQKSLLKVLIIAGFAFGIASILKNGPEEASFLLYIGQACFIANILVAIIPSDDPNETHDFTKNELTNLRFFYFLIWIALIGLIIWFGLGNLLRVYIAIPAVGVLVTIFLIFLMFLKPKQAQKDSEMDERN